MSALYAEALLNYDFYGVGSSSDSFSVPFEQTGTMVSLSGGYQFYENFFAGMNFRYLKTDVTVRLSELDTSIGNIPIELPDIDTGFTLGFAGPYLKYDTRDDNFFPTSGQLASLEMNYGFSPDDGDFSYQTYVADYANYLSIFSQDVIATRLTLCGVGGDVPFFDLCALGGTDGFRGYPVGQYLDRSLVSVQSEYRGHLFSRLGYVVFGGAATLGDGYDNLRQDIAAAAGIGVRIKLSKAFDLDFSVDAAVNLDGDATSYVYVGQRF